ncbi:MAG TPA: shikimate dehydrogenase [Methanomassiliicoccales archaeon]|nr:shikimate dehydrogenase [Methanomassiliicoccales archaeon]
MTSICVSITAKTVEEASAEARRAADEGADAIEVRFDLMDALPSDLAGFGSIPLPLIATLRSKSQGGRFEGSENERLRFLQSAIAAGFGLVDLESDSPLVGTMDAQLRGAKLIVSHHDLDKTPKATRIVETLVEESSRGQVAKAAYMTRSVSDLLSIVQAGKMFAATGKEFALIGMGATGEITRVCADRIGSTFTYASLAKGKEAASGQLDLATMKALAGEKVVAGVVGASLTHSRSAFMHHAAFAHLGIPGRYFKFESKQDELQVMTELARELDLNGFNVTIPYKVAVMPLLDSLDDIALKVKAVNTVVKEDDDLVGTNTDAYGVAKTLENARIEVSGARALVIGAGGASRAMCAALSEMGASIMIANRTRGKAEEVAKDFGGRTVALEEAAGMEFDIVMNATPLGMTGYPDELPISPRVFRRGQFVMDAIYNPPKTKFLVEAEKAGAEVRNGEHMLVQQAAKAFELWTGKEAPVEVMAEALRRSLG